MTIRFGKEQADVSYTDRCCAYAVITDPSGNVALVRGADAYFLPGGGMVDGETKAGTIHREVLEECGRQVRLTLTLGEANELFEAGGRHYRMQATFMVGRFSSEVIAPPEHDLLWRSASEAVSLVRHKSHAWAIEQWMRRCNYIVTGPGIECQIAEALSAEQSWRLLDWCISRGADEFAIEGLAVEGASTSIFDSFDRQVVAYRRQPQLRQHLTAFTTDNMSRMTELWTLNQSTLDVLKQVLPDGLFTKDLGTSKGWFEDLLVYRKGWMMLGIVTIDTEGYLFLGESEMSEVESLGIRLKRS